MEGLPKRTSLVTETALTLKEWIGSKVLRGTLPGELPLRNRLRVSRDTLRLALKSLEREGWVTPAAQGRQRQVLKPRRRGRKTPSAHLPVTFLSPFPIVDRIILLEMEDLRKHLAEEGRELQFLSPRVFQMANPHRHLARLVEENASAAWILHFVGRTAQRWFEEQGIPTFVYGTPYPGVNLPFVVNDWEAAAYHAGLQLIRQGHRNVGVLSFIEPVPGALAVVEGVRRALATAAPRAELLVFQDDRTPKSVVRSLEMAFENKPAPTALVLSGSSQLLTSLSWMVSRRIGVPTDVSLICIPSDTWFQDLYPPVCHYENNSTMFAHYICRRVMELVETGRIIRKSIRVPLEYKRGES
ncbi:MAG TPA: substrate-binding domain-containing protein, partial [Verrucomicrobiae bacterium]|nr:substrate-binding domain-containing protein [Verrucomicrobiae bacterium]